MKSWLQKKKKWISSSICLFILGSSVYFYNIENESTEQTLAFAKAQPAVQTSPSSEIDSTKKAELTGEQQGKSTPPSPASILIDVKGAVQKPGVYSLPSDARVYQAIDMAGGMLPEANARQVNRALPLKDGMMLYVPLKGEASAASAATVTGDGHGNMASASLTQEEKININTATSEQLQTIPGIGPGKAAAILQYREEHGTFKTIDELTNVSGIGAKTLEKMKDKIFAQ